MIGSYKVVYIFLFNFILLKIECAEWFTVVTENALGPYECSRGPSTFITLAVGSSPLIWLFSQHSELLALSTTALGYFTLSLFLYATWNPNSNNS